MRSTTTYLLGAGLAAALFGGCEAYVHTDAPPAKVEVHSTPAPAHVDVDVHKGPGGVNVDVKRTP